MFGSKVTHELEARTGVRRAVWLLLALMIVGNTALSIHQAFSEKATRTVITPATINRSFWVEQGAASNEYLEMMGSYVVGLYATYSPYTIEENQSLLLKLTSPDYAPDLSSQLQTARFRSKNDRISQVFWVSGIKLDQKNFQAAFVGTLDSYVEEKQVKRGEQKAFLVSFQYKDGRMTIKQLKESKYEHPFEPI